MKLVSWSLDNCSWPDGVNFLAFPADEKTEEGKFFDLRSVGSNPVPNE